MRLLLSCLFASTLTAQVVVHNNTAFAWRGWLRVPVATPQPSTWLASNSAWSVAVDDESSDVWCSCASGSSATLAFDSAPVWYRPLPQFYDIGGVHGGLPCVNGQAMSLRAVEVDGAAFTLKWSHTLDADWHVGLTVRLYPSDRCFAVGDVALLRWSPASAGSVVSSLSAPIVMAWGTSQTSAPLWAVGHSQLHGDVQHATAVFVWPTLCSLAALDAAACARLNGLTVVVQ